MPARVGGDPQQTQMPGAHGTPRQPLEARLARFEVHDVDERGVGDDRGQEGVLDDLDVLDPDELDHQERGRPP